VTSTRANIITIYSKLHHWFDLSFETLFLAVDLLDTVLATCGEKCAGVELKHLSLACFMLAIKFEEVCPPSLELIKLRMKLRIDSPTYLAAEYQVLRMVGYRLYKVSPIQYFRSLSGELTGE
jgi:G2/mitotic-specific cyclin 1/2